MLRHDLVLPVDEAGIGADFLLNWARGRKIVAALLTGSGYRGDSVLAGQFVRIQSLLLKSLTIRSLICSPNVALPVDAAGIGAGFLNSRARDWKFTAAR